MQYLLDEEICSSLLEALAKGVMAGAMLWPVARLTAEFIFFSVSYYTDYILFADTEPNNAFHWARSVERQVV